MSLADNLLVYWNMNEASGVRHNSLGVAAHDLTETDGTIDVVTGKLDNGVLLDAQTKSLRTASTVWTKPSSFSMSFWINFRTLVGGIFGIMGQYTMTNFALTFQSKNDPGFHPYDCLVINTMGSENGCYAALDLTTLMQQWLHIVFTWQGGQNPNLYCNNVSLGVITGDPVLEADLYTADGSLCFGNINNEVGDDGSYWIDEFGAWNRVLTAEERNNLYNAGRGLDYPFTVDLTTNLLAHWKLEEAAGNIRVDSHADYDFPEYSGQVGRAVGKIGSYAAAFDGANNYYLRDGGAFGEVFHPTMAYTIAAWVKRNDFGTDGSCLVLGEFGTYTPFALFVEWNVGGGVYAYRFFQQLSTSTSQESDAETVSTDWDFVVARWNGSTISLCVNNGAPVSAAAVTIIPWSDAVVTNVRTGRRDALSELFYVDSLSFWHRALSDTEIAILYNNGSGRDYPFPNRPNFIMPFSG